MFDMVLPTSGSSDGIPADPTGRVVIIGLPDDDCRISGDKCQTFPKWQRRGEHVYKRATSLLWMRFVMAVPDLLFDLLFSAHRQLLDPEVHSRLQCVHGSLQKNELGEQNHQL